MNSSATRICPSILGLSGAMTEDAIAPQRKQNSGPASPKFQRRALLQLAGCAALGLPAVSHGQSDTIKVGLTSLMSGRFALIGSSTVGAVKMLFDRVNAAGGINGRKLQLIVRDSRALPEEAVKNVRSLVGTEGCSIIMAGETSAGAAAVNEAMRGTNVLCLHLLAEYSALTADPANRSPFVFRTSRQGIHDAIGAALSYSAIAKERGIKRWATVAPDYSFGRDLTEDFVGHFKEFGGEMNLVSQSWPKLGQADFTEVVSKVLASNCEAIYSVSFGGDLLSLIEQGHLYGLFNNKTCFFPLLSDYGVIDVVKQMPKVAYTGSRYNHTFPATPENKRWYDDFLKLNGIKPTNWSWEAGLGAQLVVNALTATKGEPVVDKMAQAIRGSTVEVPFGLNGKVTMRESDNTAIRYPLAFGLAQPSEPYIKDFVPVDWDRILAAEAVWKKRRNFT